jgi:hypothetical protein
MTAAPAPAPQAIRHPGQKFPVSHDRGRVAQVNRRRASTAGPASGWHVTAVTADARRTAGHWPSGEALIDQIAARIAEAAEREPDPERKGRLQAVARGLGGAAKQIAVNVASAYLERGAHHT